MTETRTEIPETNQRPVTTQPGSGYHNPWGDYQCLWPSHPYLCAATHHRQLGTHMAYSGQHSQTNTHDMGETKRKDSTSSPSATIYFADISSA